MPRHTPSAPPATSMLAGLAQPATRWEDFDTPPTREYRITISPLKWSPVLADRLLPDLLAVDPPPWAWPYACHRHGHVWEVGADRCSACRAPWAEFGEEVATAVTRSDGHVVQVAIPPAIAP